LSRVIVDRHSTLAWPTTDAVNDLKMACVARLHPPSKGQDILLLALAGEEWRSRNWNLTFFGEGPQRIALERMVARLDLEAKVDFGGYASDIVKVWSQHHALALASRYEGTPLALLEALSLGRPALVTAVGGNAEVVVEGQNGFVAEVPTVASVNGALERLWRSRKNLSEMGVCARDRILKRYPVQPGQLFADELLDIATAH
jgi:glycosyltransferase involved in cell wall biosynthesis